jgi:hypothetical protein
MSSEKRRKETQLKENILENAFVYAFRELCQPEFDFSENCAVAMENDKPATGVCH